MTSSVVTLTQAIEKTEHAQAFSQHPDSEFAQLRAAHLAILRAAKTFWYSDHGTITHCDHDDLMRPAALSLARAILEKEN